MDRKKQEPGGSENTPKLILMDIDGTLAMEREVPMAHLQALLALKKKGHHAWICTGRPAFYPRELFGSLPEGFICVNGCSIEKQEKILFQKKIPAEDMAFIKSQALHENYGLMFSNDEGVIPFNMDAEQREHLIQMYGRDRVLDNSEEAIGLFDMFYNSREDFDRLENLYRGKIIMNPHWPVLCSDCTMGPVDKGNAVRFLREYYGLSKEDTIAFGDGLNDLTMLEEAGHPIVMENGNPLAKEKAEFITKSVMEGGILTALLKMNVLSLQDLEDITPEEQSMLDKIDRKNRSFSKKD